MSIGEVESTSNALKSLYISGIHFHTVSHCSIHAIDCTENNQVLATALLVLHGCVILFFLFYFEYILIYTNE